LDEPSRSQILLEKVWKYHQASFLAFALKLSAINPELYESAEIGGCLERFKALSTERRRRLIEGGPLLIWLKLSLACDPSGDDLKRRLFDLKRIMSSGDKGNEDEALTIPGTRVEVARFDVDSLIAEAALPEYRFPDGPRQHEFEDAVVYPVAFFQQVVTLALERIKRAWPAAHEEFSKFVSVIIDMIDSGFTSYSGYQHVGVIFVSTDNSPLVAVEEYLIHEFGHQILYNVMELDPVVVNEPDRIFRLPWSGRERDLCGYFHAFYIYMFLAHYLQRVTGRSKREQDRIADRLSHILKGLDRAAVELDAVNRFTPRGRHLFENLKKSLSAVAAA
jgi:hypothetical protein